MNELDQFLGTWTLVSSKYSNSDGEQVFPFGSDPLGRLNYDDSGNMAAQIMRADRVALEHSHYDATAEQLRACFTGVVCYFGRYHIDAQTHRIFHTVQSATYPNWQGSVQERAYRFEDDLLVLGSPPQLSSKGYLIHAELRWQRLSGC